MPTRHHRAAVAIHRDRHPAMTTTTTSNGAGRRNLHSRPAGDGGLLAAPTKEPPKVFAPDGFFKTGDIGVMDERGYVKCRPQRRTWCSSPASTSTEQKWKTWSPAAPACWVRGDQRARRKIRQKRSRCSSSERPKPHRAAGARLLQSQPRRIQKSPKYIVFRADLPQNAVGKILRRARLRDLDKEGGVAARPNRVSATCHKTAHGCFCLRDTLCV